MREARNEGSTSRNLLCGIANGERLAVVRSNCCGTERGAGQGCGGDGCETGGPDYSCAGAAVEEDRHSAAARLQAGAAEADRAGQWAGDLSEEDHELPFIDGSILIRGGSREEPAAKIGLVSLYGEAWRTSGTAAKSGDALDAELAQKAAAIETGGGLANTSVEWSSFKQDFDSVFGEAVDLLLHPAFKAEKLATGEARDGHRQSRGATTTRAKLRGASPPSWSMEQRVPTRARPSTQPWMQ